MNLFVGSEFNKNVTLTEACSKISGAIPVQIYAREQFSSTQNLVKIIMSSVQRTNVTCHRALLARSDLYHMF